MDDGSGALGKHDNDTRTLVPGSPEAITRSEPECGTALFSPSSPLRVRLVGSSDIRAEPVDVRSAQRKQRTDAPRRRVTEAITAAEG